MLLGTVPEQKASGVHFKKSKAKQRNLRLSASSANEIVNAQKTKIPRAGLE